MSDTSPVQAQYGALLDELKGHRTQMWAVPTAMLAATGPLLYMASGIPDGEAKVALLFLVFAIALAFVVLFRRSFALANEIIKALRGIEEKPDSGLAVVHRTGPLYSKSKGSKWWETWSLANASSARVMTLALHTYLVSILSYAAKTAFDRLGWLTAYPQGEVFAAIGAGAVLWVVAAIAVALAKRLPIAPARGK